MGRPLPTAAVLALATAAALAAAAAAAQVQAEYVLRITPGGVVEGLATASIDAGVNPIPLPVDPIEATIEAWIDGVRVPPLYSNGTVYIASETPGTARIEFMVDVNVEGGVVSFNVYGDAPVTLIVPPEVVLLSIPGEEIIDYEVYENGTLVLTFRGPALVEFTVREGEAGEAPPATEAPTEPTATEAETTPPPETPAATPEPGEGEGGLPLAALAAAVLVAAAAGAAALLFKRRGGGGASPPLSLNETDRVIIEALESVGGEVAQSELQRITGLPKTTLWRRLRRLEEAGIVEIRREGKINRVVLRRRPGQS